MSASYKPVLWNRQKKIYDWTLFCFIVVYLAVFCTLAAAIYPAITQETLFIRAFGTLALSLLHVILCIGPLARINRFFIPLLYNRRHLGVVMFITAAAHGVFSIIQFHGLGDVNPVVSLFVSNTHYASLTRFPFQPLGFFALLIFFLMAISSHDFWLNTFTPRIWKTLHMLVYVAYGLVVMHVALGILQYETSPVLVVVLYSGLVTVIGLHVVAGSREHRKDKLAARADDGWVRACQVQDIVDTRAKVICLEKERVAIFKYDGKLSAVSNVCKHQNGPLGEGKIVDGCITCPWHGYQYQPHNGSSPPPFKEKVATYRLKIVNGDEVWINNTPLPEGTAVTPVTI